MLNFLVSSVHQLTSSALVWTVRPQEFGTKLKYKGSFNQSTQLVNRSTASTRLVRESNRDQKSVAPVAKTNPQAASHQPSFEE
jgi:hypothetical protein